MLLITANYDATLKYDILKTYVFWKIWQKGSVTSFLGGRRMALIRLWYLV